MAWVVIFNKAIVQYNQADPFALYSQYLIILAIIFFIIILWHFTKNPLLKIVRFWYPFAFIGLLYTTTTKMDLVIWHEYLDPIIQYYDYLMFGYQPSLVWGTVYNTFFWQEFYHYFYFAYYPMIFGIPLFVYLRQERREYLRVLTNLLFVFFTCFILYVIFPVVGGRIMPELLGIENQYRHGIFTHIMAFIYRTNPHWGAAFPSSHIAVSLTLTLICFRYLRGFAWIVLLHAVLLIIATVYCHYHYVTDAIVGLVFGFVMYGISELLFSFSHVASGIDVDEW